MERSHTFALAKVNVSKIHTKIIIEFLSEILLLVKKLTMYLKKYYSKKTDYHCSQLLIRVYDFSL